CSAGPLALRSFPTRRSSDLALVKGRALAGGCGLATACDLVLAAESARFGYPEVQRGFVPAIVMVLLKRCVGEKVAFDLAATGRQIGRASCRERVERLGVRGS